MVYIENQCSILNREEIMFTFCDILNALLKKSKINNFIIQSEILKSFNWI
jgi:hypothetical protein